MANDRNEEITVNVGASVYTGNLTVNSSVAVGEHAQASVMVEVADALDLAAETLRRRALSMRPVVAADGVGYGGAT